MNENMLPTEQTTQPLVSVIMNCLNCEKYLRQAIESVYAQSYTNWEIIFWDNASDDGSAAIAQSFQDGRLRYFRGETTVPLGHARNLAIQQSKGELVAFLDCDDLWMPEKLAKQVPLFLADQEVGLVYSDSFFFSESGERKRHYAKKRPYRGFRFRELLNNYVISLETAMVRRAALDTLDHWFDVNFNMIEEYDLFVRLGLEWKIDFVPDVLASWRVHGESWTWKFTSAFPQESREMLTKLQQLPKIQQNYAPDLALAWHHLALAEAKICWEMGNGSAARRIIRVDSTRSLKSMFLWIASFFPYSAIESIHRFFFGIVKPTRA